MTNEFKQTGLVHFRLPEVPDLCIQPIQNYSPSDSLPYVWEDIARNAILHYIKTNHIYSLDSIIIVASDVTILQDSVNHIIGNVTITLAQ